MVKLFMIFALIYLLSCLLCGFINKVSCLEAARDKTPGSMYKNAQYGILNRFFFVTLVLGILYFFIPSKSFDFFVFCSFIMFATGTLFNFQSTMKAQEEGKAIQ